MSDSHFPNMITGICLIGCFQSRSQRPEAEVTTERNNNEVIAYLKFLGYRSHYDSRGGIYWHDVYNKDGDIVCQIDGGVSLDALRQDMIAWHEGREPTSKENYDIGGSVDSEGNMTESFKILCKYVADMRPETQLNLFAEQK